MQPAKYRKKPVIVEAVQWWGPFIAGGKQGPTAVQLMDWGAPIEPTAHWGGACGEDGHENNADLLITTLEDGHPDATQTEHIASPGDWIVKGIDGEYYPIKAHIFDATYEVVTPSTD